MLTIIGFIEQENWMYAWGDEEHPGYNHTSRALRTITGADAVVYIQEQRDFAGTRRSLLESVYKQYGGNDEV